MSRDRQDVDRVTVDGRDTDRHARGDVSRSGNASHARYAMDGACGIIGTEDAGARTSGVTVVAWGWSERMKRSKENVCALALEMGSIVVVKGDCESMDLTRSTISLFPYREISSEEGFTSEDKTLFPYREISEDMPLEWGDDFPISIQGNI